jgi:hypothetical protein
MQAINQESKNNSELRIQVEKVWASIPIPQQNIKHFLAVRTVD